MFKKKIFCFLSLGKNSNSKLYTYNFVFSSTLDGNFPNWFGNQKRSVMGGLSGKWLVLIWSAVLMLYLWMFESLLLSMMMKPNLEDPIDTVKVAYTVFRYLFIHT